MRNILCVRPEDRDWIRLGHYEGLDFSSPSPAKGKEGEKEQKPTMETVMHLRRRLQASQKLNVMLHAEKAKNAALLAEVRRLVGSSKQIKPERPSPQQQQNGDNDTEMTDAPTDTTPQQKPPFGFLTQTSATLSTSDASTPLTTTTAFTLSQLDSLRSLSASLRSLLPALSQPTLPTPDSEPEGDETQKKKKKPFRLQRLEYIETATRKHLEQVRGLELGVNGELRDGGGAEWVGDVGSEVTGDGEERIKRRRVEREEVEALEGVLGSLGAAGGGGGDDNHNEAGEEGGEREGEQGQEQEHEQQHSEEGQERQGDEQIQPQPQSQPEGQRVGEGEQAMETETPRRRSGRRRSTGKEKAKDQGDGDGERMDES